METNRKSVGDYIRQAGAYGIILAAFTIGVSVAGGIWSSTVSDLNGQLAIVRMDLDRAKEELFQVKSDYLSYKTMNEAGYGIKENTISSDGKIEVGKINNEKSHSFFNGDVTISLVAISFEGSPLRYRVLANVSSPNGEAIKIEKGDIGNVLKYKGKNTYQITLIKVDTFSATFQVIQE